MVIGRRVGSPFYPAGVNFRLYTRARTRDCGGVRGEVEGGEECGEVGFEVRQYLELRQAGEHSFLFVGMLKIFNFATVSTA